MGDGKHTFLIRDPAKVKLKQDLKIGELGYPQYIVIGGDQQTYIYPCKNFNKKNV